MKINLNGTSNIVTTFYATDDVKEGDIVTLTDNYTVDVAQNGDQFTGICLGVREGIATVQMKGYIKREYSGTAPKVGVKFFAADGEGKVKTVSAGLGRSAIVVAVDTATSTAEFVIH